MPERFRHVPLDHPYLAQFEAAHEMDRDPGSTIIAIGLVDDALAAGHPEDPSAAGRVMTGASGAAHFQAGMQAPLAEADEHDQAAEEHSLEAVQRAQEARQAAGERRRLPDESVQLADGSSLTRGQVHQRHDKLLEVAAQREGRGDFEHNALPPGPAVRALIITVLSVIEVFLLIWPVTDASWGDLQSVGYVLSLVAVFLFMNEQMPRLAGQSIREAREAVHAAWENTRVGLSAGRRGDPGAGREITGHVDGRHVRDAERKKRIRCTALGGVLCVYAAVMFTRVERLATGLGWPLPFVLLAAGLVTVFTAGSVLVMTWWWSRGNGLGDHLREHGAITGESRAIAGDLGDQSRAHARASDDAADLSRRRLDLAEQAIQRGYQTVGLGLQKAAKILGQDSVPVPRPENLFPPGRPVRDRAAGNIERARGILAEAQQMLSAPPPFHPAGAAPNPWESRSAARQAAADPRFAGPDQLGPLHAPAAAPVVRWRRRWARLALVACLLVAVLATAAILFHGWATAA
jgi:hypothetical protein